MTTEQEIKKSNWKAKLGKFSKAIKGAVAINFSESGSENCDKSCTMHPVNGGACYAKTTEDMRPSVHISGERKRIQGFAITCLQTADDLAKRIAKGQTIPWIRLSTLGSVPNRKLSHLEEEAFKHLMVCVIATGSPVHFPVETEAKRDRFQALCDDVKHGAITVRLSAQTIDNALRQDQPSSVVWTQGKNKRERLANAKKWAFAHRASHGAMVCPAIESTVLRKEKKVKCGACKACSQPAHLVIYPQH